MEAVWQVGEGAAGDVLAILCAAGRERSESTGAPLLRRLSRQGSVERRRNGRQVLYRARVQKEEAAKGMLKRLGSSFFGGKVSALTAQLLESEELSAEDLRELRELIKGKGR